MRTFAWWSVRHRWWVVGGWVALAALLAGLSTAVGGAKYADGVDLADGYGSQQVQELLERDFPQAAGEQVRVVVQATDGRVVDLTVREQLEAMLARVAELPHVADVTSPYASQGQAISGDQRTAFAVVTFDQSADDLPDDAVPAVIETAETPRAPALDVALIGQAVQPTEAGGPGVETIVGLGVAMLVMLVLFGSVVAMLVPMVTVLVAIAAGISVNSMVTHVLSQNTATLAIALMIALGVGIDYALFMVSKFRNLLADGRSPDEAAVEAVDTSGRAVVLAGGIVVVALLLMLVFGVNITTGIAVGSAVEVAFTIAAALTLLPAILSILGHRIDNLRVPGRHPGATAGSPRLRAWAAWVRRSRWGVAVAGTGVLAALALPLVSLQLGQSDASAGPAESTTHRAYEMLADGFGPGFSGPLTVAVTLPDSSDSAVVDRLADALGSDRGVASVTASRVSPDGATAVLQVYPASSPQDPDTSELVSRVRDTLIPAATEGTGVDAYVGGPTATFIDLSTLLASRLLLFIALVVAIGLVALLVVFRSIAIPITAAVLNLLSIGAALGVVVAIFQLGWTGLPTGPIDFALPVMMVAIVFGLSTDYQVFLLSSVHEEWLAHSDNNRAVREGMARVSGVITGAALIMIAVFGSFVPGGQRLLQEIGTGFGVAVALDAFLIRFALVPALMYILGDWNWRLPSWLGWIPRVHVESGRPDAAGSRDGAAGVVLASDEG